MRNLSAVHAADWKFKRNTEFATAHGVFARANRYSIFAEKST
jgi:hypothetical protein